MKRTRFVLVVLFYLGLLAPSGIAVATPLDFGLALGTEIDAGNEDLAGRGVSAVGPTTQQTPGLTIADLIESRLGNVRFSEPSSALLLGLGLLGLAVLSGRKFDVPSRVTDSAPR